MCVFILCMRDLAVTFIENLAFYTAVMSPTSIHDNMYFVNSLELTATFNWF